MTKVFVFDNTKTGNLSVTKPVWRNQGPIETEDEFLARVKSRIPDYATNITMMEFEDVPTDRRFRNAWKQNGPIVDHDMVKARDIHMDKIRVARDIALNQLDININRAEDSGGGDAGLRAKRQPLRDLPQTFDLSGATSPDELDALWPDILETR